MQIAMSTSTDCLNVYRLCDIIFLPRNDVEQCPCVKGERRGVTLALISSASFGVHRRRAQFITFEFTHIEYCNVTAYICICKLISKSSIAFER